MDELEEENASDMPATHFSWGPFLLTRINFNHSMDTELHTF